MLFICTGWFIGEAARGPMGACGICTFPMDMGLNWFIPANAPPKQLIRNKSSEFMYVYSTIKLTFIMTKVWLPYTSSFSFNFVQITWLKRQIRMQVFRRIPVRVKYSFWCLGKKKKKGKRYRVWMICKDRMLFGSNTLGWFVKIRHLLWNSNVLFRSHWNGWSKCGKNTYCIYEGNA